jgi:hypothetical protein
MDSSTRRLRKVNVAVSDVHITPSLVMAIATSPGWCEGVMHSRADELIQRALVMNIEVISPLASVSPNRQARCADD